MGRDSPLRYSQVIDYGDSPSKQYQTSGVNGMNAPNRQRSIASTTSSSAYSYASDPFQGGRSSTISSRSSVASQYLNAAQKRGFSEATSPMKDSYSARQSLRKAAPASHETAARPLWQSSTRTPFGAASQNASPPSRFSPRSKQLETLRDELENDTPTFDHTSSPPPQMKAHTVHCDGPHDQFNDHQIFHSENSDAFSIEHQLPSLTDPDLEKLKKSGTGHLRTLSRLALENDEEFSLDHGNQVSGLQGRRRLQRGGSVRQPKASPRPPVRTGWGSTQWMDKQRQFIQAYEYLCHIGEAKEWIEKVILHDIPPVIQLEETLRDGVTLAETVQALTGRPVKIYHNPKLQYRHSDNIAIFFKYLHQVELPDLFHFELVDLYEKKNIPKVIYCIHALSWLLFKQGAVDFRIGNLVGRLQFEDHELESTQKGLDQAGVSMPSFEGVGQSFGAQVEEEPEPVESEEERQERELREEESVIVNLQAQIRGAIARARLTDVMEEQWSTEAALIDLQARIRGEFARQIFGYKLMMNRFATNLQSAARGYLLRTGQQRQMQMEKVVEPQVLMIQSIFRAQQSRERYEAMRSKIHTREPAIVKLQAKIRGAAQRRRLHQMRQDNRASRKEIAALQASLRGFVLRQRLQADRLALRRAAPTITELQARIRGALKRGQFQRFQTRLGTVQPTFVKLQAALRASRARQNLSERRVELRQAQITAKPLHAAIKGFLVRQTQQVLQTQLSQQESKTKELQSLMRAHLARSCQAATVHALHEQGWIILHLQAQARGCVYRQRHGLFLQQLRSHQPSIALLQGLARAMLCRRNVGTTLNELDDAEEALVDLQACIRGAAQRLKYQAKLQHYQENMKKVIKIQSFVRGKQQGEAYKSLTTGKNPPVGTIKNFVHLLNDSDLDFDEEVEFEHLRKIVIQQVRSNELAEQYINEVDIKIALLVKNKITLDEVIKHQRLFGGLAGALLGNHSESTSKDPFDLKALNKNSRHKLELYQDFFFLLQTQPQYLSRLFQRMKDSGAAETEVRKLETLVMTLYGFAQKRREEYYLLKLIAKSIEDEVENYSALVDVQRRSGFWSSLLTNYTKSPRDRTFLRVTFGSLIKTKILENGSLDFESNPSKIYRTMLSQQELRTGHRSGRPQDLTVDQAIQDPEVREIYIKNLRDLRAFADEIVTSLEDNAPRAPFGIRMVAQQLHRSLMRRFAQDASPDEILLVVTQWLWRTYLQQALVHPEQQGVTPGGLSPLHRKSLDQTGHLFNQVISGRPFGNEDSFLRSLNTWLEDATPALMGTTARFLDVQLAEEYFDIDTFNDLFARQKPILYIKMVDIFALHHFIANNLSSICSNREDQLCSLVQELGSVKSNEDAMQGMRKSEISLTLSAKLHDAEDPDAAIKTLFMETKRCVLYIIRIQAGQNLMEILIRPVTVEDENKWHRLLFEEQQDPTRKAAYSENPSSLLDFTRMPYSELKKIALENVLALERAGRINRYNNYQDLLNAIALDIRTKHRRRVQRQRELDGVRQTLGNLSEKKSYLDSQLQSYNNYIEQAMGTLQKQKGKKKFLLPFTKQYNHERELARQGRVVKFGSFKYSARALADKGVLVFFEGWDLDAAQYDRVNVTIESETVGRFHVEGSIGSMMLTGASEDIELDRLLQYQFENKQYLEMFGGQMKLNVNLFLHLIFKKFYRDE